MLRLTLNKNQIMVITVAFICMLTGMEFDVVLPSLPDLQQHFMLRPFQVERLLSVNFIGYCLCVFFVGIFSDRYGRKLPILIGLIAFMMGTSICLWGMSYHGLILGRFLQGVGIAAPAVISILILADAYPIKKQQYFMAMINGVLTISEAMAPVIGSYITLYFHWQGNFIYLLFAAAIAFAMTMIFISTPKLPKHEHKEKLLFSSYKPLFQSKTLILLIMSVVFMFTPFWIFIGMSPLLYMKALDVSLYHFGYYEGSLNILFALASVLFGLTMHRYKQKQMINVAVKIFALSLITIALATYFNIHNPLMITLAFAPFVLAQVIPSALIYPLCLNFIPNAKGKISALLQGSNLIMAAIALRFAGYFYKGSFRNIGIIISVFIFLEIITLIFLLKNRALSQMFSNEQ